MQIEHLASKLLRREDVRSSTAPEAELALSAATHWDAQYLQSRRSAWTENRDVFSEVNRRMTGSPNAFWIDWFFQSFLDRPVRRLLSIGCGNGTHELMILQRGHAAYVHGFDASNEGIAQARERAQRDGLNADFAVGYFEDFVQRDSGERYDVVMFAGSLHHARDIEGMLAAAQKSMTDDGVLLVNEYVGACYQIYPPHQIAMINRILDSIDPIFKISPSAQVRQPTIEQVFAADPSEGVRSALIMPMLPMFFKNNILSRPFGGGLLHSLFDCLNGAKINDGSMESSTLVRSLILIENEMTAARLIPNDFFFGAFRAA
jgi:2-polyprenyl-3-methyl-5-hydroxy-6-metoxy-1,4-benzoquinol methylase